MFPVFQNQTLIRILSKICRGTLVRVRDLIDVPDFFIRFEGCEGTPTRIKDLIDAPSFSFIFSEIFMRVSYKIL